MAESLRPEPLSYPDQESGSFQPAIDDAARKSLLAGLMFLFTPLPVIFAIVLGIIGIERTRGINTRGRAHAVAGLSLGIFGIFAWIGIVWGILWIRTSFRVHAVQEHMRSLGQGLSMYAYENRGAYPDSFATLLSSEYAPAAFCEDLGDVMPEGTPLAQVIQYQRLPQTSIVYLGMDATASGNKGNIVVAYVSLHAIGRDEYVLLYNDGHQERYPPHAAIGLIQKRIEQIATAATQMK